MKGDKSIFLIDTNVLVYAYSSDDQKKQKAALEILEKCWKREVYYAISLQNLAEFFVVITQKSSFSIEPEHARKIIFDIIHFSHWKIIQYSSDALLYAATKEKRDFWDCLIVATMLENGISHIYTENVKDFSAFPHIHIENPFAK